MASQSSSLAAVNTAFTPSNAAQTAALAAVNKAFAPAPATSAPASTSFNSSASGLNVPAPVSTPYTGTVQPGGSFDTSGNYTPPAAQPAAPTYNAQGVITGAAPSGSQKSANGNWIDSAGNQYTQAPAGNSSSTVGGGSQGNALPNSSGADSTFSTAMNALAPGGVPSESDFYNEVYSQLAPVIAAITGAESSAETAAYAAGTQQQNSLSASLGARGLAGSGEANVEAANTNLATAQNVANAQQAAATALENVTQFAIPEAYTMYSDALTRNDTNAKAYVAQAQTNLSNSLAGLAQSGITLDSYKTSNPAGYAQLLQYANGDPNILTEIYLQAATKNSSLLNSGQPLYTNGNTLTYGVSSIDPTTGKPTLSTQTLTIPFAITSTTTGWTWQKTGTNSTALVDPNNAANYIAYTTDPISANVTVTGGGTGLTDLQSAGITPGVPGNGNSQKTNSSSSTGTGYTSTFSSTTGVTDLTTPLNSSTIDSAGGVGNIVAGIIASEGGSVSGVKNNPGNVKYVAGMTGATDSGIKAADGGTYANFDTLQDGQNAIASIVTDAASGTNPLYGASPTFQSFLNTYANLSGSGTTSTTGAVGSNGLPISEYGLMANVSGFDPGTPDTTQTDAQFIDSAAWNLISTYESTGVTPTVNSSMGGVAALGVKNKILSRAEQLFNQATGKNMQDPTMSSNISLLQGNNTLLNTLGYNSPTIQKNLNLLEGNITAGNINQNAPAINAVIDPIINALGNPAVASYLAQNQTLANELGSLLALKGASGSGASTVHDKLIAAGLISPNSSADQIAATVNTILKEAQNAQEAISKQSISLYQQVDPLGIDPNNPMNNPSYSQLTSAGLTWGGGNSYIAPDGSVYSVDSNGGVTETQ
jgi:hypothetical protein